MRKLNLRTLILALMLIQCANGLRILGIFPHLGASHFRFFQPIMKRLAEVGHQVTVISAFPEKNPLQNYTDLVLTGVDELSVDLQVNVTHLFTCFLSSAHINSRTIFISSIFPRTDRFMLTSKHSKWFQDGALNLVEVR